MLTPDHLPHQYNTKRRLFLTADEHYFHSNIIGFCNRPYADVLEMNEALIANHNSLVTKEDCVIHVGDFVFGNANSIVDVIERLNGYHFLMDGSHDRALQKYLNEDPKNIPKHVASRICVLPKLFEFKYQKEKIVLCHYAMMRWWASHHGSYHFFGHSHGKLDHPGKAIDVGVDARSYLPVTIEEVLVLADSKVK